MGLKNQFTNLCSPAQLYVVLAAIGYIALVVSNFSKPKEYRVGNKVVKLGHHNVVYFVMKLLVILLWTYVLNKFCTWGWSPLSWVLVLFPFVFFLLAFFAVLVAKARKLL